MPIGAPGSPRCKDFTNPNDTPETQSRDVLVEFRGIQRASLECDLQCGFNLSLRLRLQEPKSEEFFYAKLIISTESVAIKSI